MTTNYPAKMSTIMIKFNIYIKFLVVQFQIYITFAQRVLHIKPTTVKYTSIAKMTNAFIYPKCFEFSNYILFHFKE